MLVDDDAHVISAMQRLLKRSPLEVVSAQSGEAALALLNQVQPALIICDYQMSGMDGLTFLTAARQCCPAAILVLHTGTTASPDAASGIRLLHKPCEPAALLALLGEIKSDNELGAPHRFWGAVTRRG